MACVLEGLIKRIGMKYLVLAAIVSWVLLLFLNPFIGGLVAGTIVLCALIRVAAVSVETIQLVRRFPARSWHEILEVRPLLVWARPVDVKWQSIEGYTPIPHGLVLKAGDHIEVEYEKPSIASIVYWAIKAL